MIKRKTKAKLNRTLSGILAVIMTASMTSVLPASAEDEVSPYPYTLFAGSSDDGAISSTAGNFCVNGNVATNGTFSVGSNFNVNGTKTEHADVDMPIIFDQIDDKFFSGEVDMHSEDYSYSETNINVTVPIEVQGVLSLDGNITLTTGLKALDDVTLTGEVKNTDGSVICSQTGDIFIDSDNVNLGGLVYAPYGTVSLKAQNLNLNNVVIIADKISIDAPNVNANSSSSMAQFVGEAIAASNNNSDNNGGESGSQTDEEPLIYAFGSYNEEENAIDIEWHSNIDGSYEILESADNDVYTIVAEVSEFTTYRYPIEDDFDTKYFKVKVTSSDNTAESVPFIVTRSDDGYSVDFLDSDGDGLADIYEDIIGTNANNADTDDDGLSDYDEVYITGTDPTKYDSVTDAVSDYDADNDSDGLGNGREIELGTEPMNPDTDDDDLSDGEEVNSYGTDPLVPDTDNDGLDDVAEIEFETDPLNPDSDSNGVLDGDEKRQQTFTFEVENKDCAVSEVTVSSECTGYLKNSMTVHSIMNEDQLCSNIVGLVGEPFEIETTSDFDTATITFSINKSKLKGKSLDDLQFLWYDEENDEFIELPTSFDENNSSISVETTHFSKYAAVDSDKWENNWNEILTDLKMLETADIKDTQTSVNIVFDRSFTDSCADPVTYVDNFAYCNRLTLIKDLLSSFDYRCSKVTEIGNGTYTIIDPYGRDYDLDVDEYSEVLFHTNATKHYGYLYPVKCFEFDPTYTNLNMTSVLYVVDTVENQMKYKFPDSEPINIYIIANNYTEYYYDQIEYDYSRELSKINSKLYVIDMCPEDHSLLQSIAESTGGEYLKYTPANVEHLKSILSSGSYGSALKDSDKDGFSDMEEERIGLVSSNGVRHYTNAHSKYSDEDSFTDNEEASKYFTTESDMSSVKKKYHTMTSYPDMEDSDGDGVNDEEDALPLHYNDSVSYIFVPYDVDEIFDFIAKGYEFKLRHQTNDIIQIVYCKNTQDFEDFWNNMDLTQEGKVIYKINQVHLLGHGDPHSLEISGHGSLYGSVTDEYFSLDNGDISVGQLQNKEIELLNTIGCNCGNLDFNSDINGDGFYGDNLAISFLRSNYKIKKVTAWDGYTKIWIIPEKARESGFYCALIIDKMTSTAFSWRLNGKSEFQKWSKDVNGCKRNPIGLITFYIADDDSIISNPSEKHFID